MHEDIGRVLYSADDIARRIEELGRTITADYADRAGGTADDLVMVCVLRGAAVFMADLARAVKLPAEMDYMCLSSYGSSATSSGMVRIQKDLSCQIEGRHVIVVEDIVDTGLTLHFLQKNLASRGPASVETAALLVKRRAGGSAADVRYVGFECPDEFIVGYGLDYAQRYRNLPYIGVLDPAVYRKS